MRSDFERLGNILDALEQIENCATQGELIFQQDKSIQVCIIYHFQVMGEAVRAFSSSLKNQHPEVSWSEIIGMRNFLIHTYYKINLRIVWGTVVNDLPILKPKIEAIVQQLSGNP